MRNYYNYYRWGKKELRREEWMIDDALGTIHSYVHDGVKG